MERCRKFIGSYPGNLYFANYLDLNLLRLVEYFSDNKPNLRVNTQYVEITYPDKEVIYLKKATKDPSYDIVWVEFPLPGVEDISWSKTSGSGDLKVLNKRHSDDIGWQAELLIDKGTEVVQTAIAKIFDDKGNCIETKIYKLSYLGGIGQPLKIKLLTEFPSLYPK